jgi:hypothetical protein
MSIKYYDGFKLIHRWVQTFFGTSTGALHQAKRKPLSTHV